MGRLFLIYVGFLLLYWGFGPTTYTRATPPAWTQWTYYELRDRHDHHTLAAIHSATVTGQKIKFPRRVQKILRSLHLQHLITPSGLHLSLLTSFLFPLLARRTRVMVLLPLLFLSNFHSLKRVALLKIFGSFKFSLWQSFLLAMVIDFLFGSFQPSPLSFMYGFLFLGSVIATASTSALASTYIPFSLLGAQVVLSFATSEPLFLAGYFLGLALTMLFGLLFPLLLLDFFLLFVPLWPLWSVSHYFLKLWWKLVLWCEPVARSLGPSEVSLFGLLAVFLILLKKFRLAGLMIFLNVTQIWNAPLTKSWQTTIERPSAPIKVIPKKYGFETWHEQKRRCRHRHRPVGFEIKCN